VENDTYTIIYKQLIASHALAFHVIWHMNKNSFPNSSVQLIHYNW